MAQVEVDIFNLALSAVGSDAKINDPNENSREAELCRLWYPEIRNRVQRAAPWAACKSYRRLQLRASRTDNVAWADGDPEPGWMYAFTLPDDFLWPQFVTTYSRFVLGRVGTTNCLMSNEASPILIYTARNTDIGKWDQGLVDAVSYALAAALTMPLEGKPDRTKMNLDLANVIILEARVREANQDTQMLESLPPWLSARGAGGLLYPDRFIYPVGPVLATSDLSV